METLAKKLGTCIGKSQLYYEARFKVKEYQQETQRAAIRFEKANCQHAASKEMVYLAEEGLKAEGRCFDHAWQVNYTILHFSVATKVAVGSKVFFYAFFSGSKSCQNDVFKSSGISFDIYLAQLLVAGHP